MSATAELLVFNAARALVSALQIGAECTVAVAHRPLFDKFQSRRDHVLQHLLPIL